MAAFDLRIVTPDGMFFDGQAESLTVRTIGGEICILPGHIDFVTVLGMGEARVSIDGTVRSAACIGGMLSVTGNEVKLVPTTFEWAEDIDLDRAKNAEQAARERLGEPDLDKQDRALAEAKLKRALVRQSVAKRK